MVIPSASGAPMVPNMGNKTAKNRSQACCRCHFEHSRLYGTTSWRPARDTRSLRAARAICLRQEYSDERRGVELAITETAHALSEVALEILAQSLITCMSQNVWSTLSFPLNQPQKKAPLTQRHQTPPVGTKYQHSNAFQLCPKQQAFEATLASSARTPVAFEGDHDLEGWQKLA